MSNIDEISQMISTIDGKITDNAQTVASVSYTHLTLPTN